MYKKREEFDFVVGKVKCRLVVDFVLDESKVRLAFVPECVMRNKEVPALNNNCLLGIGELTHLTAIFLYESVVELLENEPLIIPSPEAFDDEETDLFEIVLEVSSGARAWEYDSSSTFCSPHIVLIAEPIFTAVASALVCNEVVRKLKSVSPSLVWPTVVHEFMHHADHVAITRLWKVETKYKNMIKKVAEAHSSEANPSLLLFLLLGGIRAEGFGWFCKEFESQQLSFGTKSYVTSMHDKILGFASSLNGRLYAELSDAKYFLGRHLCCIIALGEAKERKLRVKRIHRYRSEVTECNVDVIISDFLNDVDDWFLLLPDFFYNSARKNIIRTKNFAQFLTLYENSCNAVGIPLDARFLCWEEYHAVKKTVYEKTKQGKKITQGIWTVVEWLKRPFR